MIKKIMIFALPVLMLAACTREDATAGQEIALTTPVIELGEVQASTRAAVGSSTVSNAIVFLSLHDSEDREVDQDRLGEYEFNGSSWTHTMAPTVTGGKGYYRAGIFAVIDLRASGSNMPAIISALYAHRGSINVEANGTFAPTAELEPLTSAVLVVLKNANGETIDPSTSGSKYLITSELLKYVDRVVPGEDGQIYPNGTSAPEYWKESVKFNLNAAADGFYFPCTYFEDKNGGTIFEVTYCDAGFDCGIPKGSSTTWIVNYPAGESLTMEAGKLYTFTITLGKDAHITLDTENAVTVDSWVTGSQISVGK